MKAIKNLQQKAHNLIFNLPSDRSQSEELQDLKDDIKITCFGFFLSGIVFGMVCCVIFSILSNLK